MFHHSLANNDLLKRFFVVALCMAGIHGNGQDLSYAKTVVKTLCSPEFHGRGYVQAGDRKAAEFIAGEFERHGLEKVSGSYFQNFTVPVNTFPGNMELRVDGKILLPGTDYLIDPGAPAVKGSFSILNITDDLLLDENKFAGLINDSKNKFIAIHITGKKFTSEDNKELQDKFNLLKYGVDIPSRGTLIFSPDKLTWSGSTRQFSKPVITLRAQVASSPVLIKVRVQSKFIPQYATQNVMGLLKGTAPGDSLLIVTAHYDHLGMMGKETYFPGANDNASGIALLLNLAKYYQHPEHRLTYSILFIAFAAEEIGLMGSAYYTDNPVFPLAKIKFLLNFDLAGTGDDGIQVVNGSVYKKQFESLRALNDKDHFVKEVKIRGEACNSDHCMFHRKGVPCFFIYTLGGISAYHDVNDKAETLPFTEFEDYFSLMTGFLKTL
jgi:hypothetical protein